MWKRWRACGRSCGVCRRVCADEELRVDVDIHLSMGAVDVDVDMCVCSLCG